MMAFREGTNEEMFSEFRSPFVTDGIKLLAERIGSMMERELIISSGGESVREIFDNCYKKCFSEDIPPYNMVTGIFIVLNRFWAYYWILDSFNEVPAFFSQVDDDDYADNNESAVVINTIGHAWRYLNGV